MASRSSFQHFNFESKMITPSNFQSLNFNEDQNELTNFECLTARINETYKKLDLVVTDCSEKHLIICRKVNFVKPNCSETSSYTNHTPFSILLNPSTRLKYKQLIAYQKAEIMEMYEKMQLEKAYQSLFQSLWYSFIPCFDVRNISFALKDMSLLNYCEWKGIPIECSSIFTTFPTDQGMCCSFNMDAADDIYRESTYKANLQKMQDADKINSFKSIPPSARYTPTKKPQAGQNRGLMMMVDSHSNWLFPGSFDGDFHSLTAFIHSSGSFPLMNQGGVIIRPGYDNIITLTSLKKNADSDLIFHKKYSYANCKFECAFSYAKNEAFLNFGAKCQPWFFPITNNSNMICDPWVSSYFFQIISKEIPDALCSQCLPDCSTTYYDSTVVAVPFQKCDSSNLGVSQFCQLVGQRPLQENVLVQIVKEFTEYNLDGIYNSDTPDYIPTAGDMTIRTYGYNIFEKTPSYYFPYDRDMAMVEIIFQKSTLVEMESQHAMSWTDYFSAVGGLLGLVLGMGFYSLFELVWLCARIVSKYFNHTNWIA